MQARVFWHLSYLVAFAGAIVHYLPLMIAVVGFMLWSLVECLRTTVRDVMPGKGLLVAHADVILTLHPRLACEHHSNLCKDQ